MSLITQKNGFNNRWCKGYERSKVQSIFNAPQNHIETFPFSVDIMVDKFIF